jgi:hypothetical protein
MLGFDLRFTFIWQRDDRASGQGCSLFQNRGRWGTFRVDNDWVLKQILLGLSQFRQAAFKTTNIYLVGHVLKASGRSWGTGNCRAITQNWNLSQDKITRSCGEDNYQLPPQEPQVHLGSVRNRAVHPPSGKDP